MTNAYESETQLLGVAGMITAAQRELFAAIGATPASNDRNVFQLAGLQCC